MALTLSYGQTSTIKAYDSAGNLQTFDLGVRMSELVPQITIPSILEVIRNTSAPNVESFANARFFSLAKHRAPTNIYNNGNLVNAGSSITPDTIRTEVVQLTPIEIGDKLIMDDIDLNTDKFESALALSAATWILQNRVETEVAVFKEAALAAQDIQAKIVAAENTSTTFDKGAHFDKTDINTPDEAYNKLSELKAEIQRVGLTNAKNKLNKEYKFSTGINLEDVIVICSSRFIDLICAKPGVFASDLGNADFKNMNIKKLLGLNVIEVSTLHEGINFMVVTTGIHGAICYMTIADGLKMMIDKDPSWFMSKRLDIAKQYITGIVHPFLIWVQAQANTTITRSAIKGKVSTPVYTNEHIDQYSVNESVLTNTNLNEKEIELLNLYRSGELDKKVEKAIEKQVENK